MQRQVGANAVLRTSLGTTLLFGGVVAALSTSWSQKTAQTGEASEINGYQSLGASASWDVFYAAVLDGDMRLLFGGTDPGEVLALFALGILANALPLVIYIEPFRRFGIEGRVLPDAIAVVATLLSALALRASSAAALCRNYHHLLLRDPRCAPDRRIRGFCSLGEARQA